MTHPLLANPFETSPAPTSQAVESAVAPNTPPPSAAAGLIEASNLETYRVTAVDQACGSTESRSAGSGNRVGARADPGERTAPKRFVSGEAGVAPGPQDQFPPGFDPEKFIEACLKTDDPMPLFLAAPRKEYLAIMGER